MRYRVELDDMAKECDRCGCQFLVMHAITYKKGIGG